MEEIVEDQKATAITQVGARGHIEAYQKNRETLQQVGMDIMMLRNMTGAQEVPEEGEKSDGGSEVQPPPQAPPRSRRMPSSPNPNRSLRKNPSLIN